MALKRFLYHITTNTDSTEDSVHCFRDDTGRWLAYTIDDKSPAPFPVSISASTNISHPGLTAATRSLPPEHNERLLNTLFRQHLNQNICFDLNYALTDVNDSSDLSSNYIGQPVNCSGLGVILDPPTIPNLVSPVNNNNGEGSLSIGGSGSICGSNGTVNHGLSKIQNPLQGSSSTSSTSGSNQQTIVSSTGAVCSQTYEIHTSPMVRPPPSMPYNNFTDRHRRLRNLLGNLDTVTGASNNSPNEPPPPNQVRFFFFFLS